MTSRRRGLAPLGAVLLLGVPAAALAAGTDEQAVGLIRELVPGYQPWFTAVFAAPGEEAESWLFALQGLLGLAGLAGCFALLRRRVRAGRKEALHAD